MTIIKNVLTLTNMRKDYVLEDGNKQIIDGNELLAVPGLIDPHVHFRVPGLEYKEDWISGACAAFKGGYTTVFDMPNVIPATNTFDRLKEKMSLIDSQILASRYPLKYKLFFGADKNNFDQICLVKDSIVGIKVFLGSSTGDLLMNDLSSLHALYALAKQFDLIVAVHAEDELVINHNKQIYQHETDFKYHSIIRSPEAAAKAVAIIIELSKIYEVTSYILHVSTKEEIELITKAKAQGIKLYVETCPHYLFLDETNYLYLNGKAKVNPPLRSLKNKEYMWYALNEGLIDTIASDHAPHLESEKMQDLHKCPSGMPGIETTFPLMFTAYTQGKIDLQKIIDLTVTNPRKIFNLPDNDDVVFVNYKKFRTIKNQELASKVKWSAFAGMNLTGFPEYLFTDNRCFNILD